MVLLEARRIGWGASGRNGGQMIPGLRWGVGDLISALGTTRTRDLLALANLLSVVSASRLQYITQRQRHSALFATLL